MSTHQKLIDEILNSPVTPKDHAAKAEILRLRAELGGKGSKPAKKANRSKKEDADVQED